MSKKFPEICEFCNNKSRYHDFPSQGIVTCGCEAPKIIHDECLFNKIDYTKEYYYHKKIDLPCEICNSKLLLNGTFYTYHRVNGLLCSERNYKDSVLHGVYKEYDYDGESLMKLMNYKDGKVDGLFKEWNRTPEGDRFLEVQENYKDGLLDGLSFTYAEDGYMTKVLYKENVIVENFTDYE
jgi:antitoxin component YwqK of YwqJK toxin-antitoxin module